MTLDSGLVTGRVYKSGTLREIILNKHKHKDMNLNSDTEECEYMEIMQSSSKLHSMRG
jgi:hypothetical protein